MRAVIASLLECELEELPKFESDFSKSPTWEEYYLELQRWLSQKGFQLIEIQLTAIPWMPVPFDSFAIFIGPHISGCRHAIVGKLKGLEFFPVFDPLNPQGDPEEAFVDGKLEAVCLLVARDPFFQVNAGRFLEQIESMAAQFGGVRMESIRELARQGLGKPAAQLITRPNGDRP